MPLAALERLVPQAADWSEYDTRMTALSDRVRKGDERAVEEMVSLSLWVIRKEVSRFPQLDRDEATQEALIAMVSCCRSWDPRRGWKFQSMAAQVIRRELTRAVQRLNSGTGVSERVAHAHALIRRLQETSAEPVSHAEAVERLNISPIIAERTKMVLSVSQLDESHHDVPGEDDIFEVARAHDARRVLGDVLEVLTDTERKVLEMVTGHGRSVNSVALEMGMTPSAVSRTHARALARTREHVADISSPL